jgi:hypothetical protein
MHAAALNKKAAQPNMLSSAARLSVLIRPVAFRPLFTKGLTLSVVIQSCVILIYNYGFVNTASGVI